jgi:hypothetical protein
MQLYLFSLLTLHVSASCSHLQVVFLLYTMFSTEAAAFVMPIFMLALHCINFRLQFMYLYMQLV